MPVRVTKHNVILPCGDGEQVSETCTLATTLLDHRAVGTGQVRDAYQARWPASETTFGQDKATIAGAGDRASGPVLRSGSPRLVIQEFWAWMTATHLVCASAAAALDSGAAAARALRRWEPAGPVDPVLLDGNVLGRVTQQQVPSSQHLVKTQPAVRQTAGAQLLNIRGRDGSDRLQLHLTDEFG